jgi:tight adherence protein C
MTWLLAQIDAAFLPVAVTIASSIVVGVCVAAFSQALTRIVLRARRHAAETWEFEDQRRIRLRKGSIVYRLFEPLVDELAARNRAALRPEILETLRRQLAVSAAKLPWNPDEYLAVGQMESLLAAVAGAVFGFLFSGVGLAVAGAFGGFWAYQRLVVKGLTDKANARARRLKSRLPFALDLMALMMQAGAGFLESLQAVVRENKGHPLGIEFGDVLARIAAGQSRAVALDQLRSRLADDDVSEIVFAINKGEELGTPLSEILRTQADQMRLKRSQWIEKAVGEAQVMIVFPGMIIMLACLLIITAPYVLSAMNTR